MTDKIAEDFFFINKNLRFGRAILEDTNFLNLYLIDFLNDNNDTFETLYCKYNSRVDFYKFMPNNCIPLKCLAARVINKNFFDLKKRVHD